MLRIVHPAREGQPTDPSAARRRRGPSPALSLTSDESRALRATIRNAGRAYGSIACFADAMRVPVKTLYKLSRHGAALALAAPSGSCACSCGTSSRGGGRDHAARASSSGAGPTMPAPASSPAAPVAPHGRPVPLGGARGRHSARAPRPVEAAPSRAARALRDRPQAGAQEVARHGGSYRSACRVMSTPVTDFATLVQCASAALRFLRSPGPAGYPSWDELAAGLANATETTLRGPYDAAEVALQAEVRDYSGARRKAAEEAYEVLLTLRPRR